MRAALWMVAGVLVGSTASAQAQTPLVIDLATLPVNETFNDVLPAGDRFTIEIVNRVPLGFLYRVTAVPEDQVIGPLSLEPIAPPAGTPKADADCGIENETKITNAVKRLTDVTEERDVPPAVTQANQVIRTLSGTACASNLTTLRGLVAGTRDTILTVSVGRGQDLVVTVVRLKKDATQQRVWTVRYRGRSRGEWLTTYGFAFLTEWPWGPSSQSFTAKATDTQGDYVITQDGIRDRVRFVPTVLFTWQPSPANVSPNLSTAISAGLGINQTSPVVTIGPSLVWNRNLSIHIGAAAAKVDRLLGQYAVGDTVGELSPGQLVTPVYRINPFIALSFNFSSSPFPNTPPAAPKVEPPAAEVPADNKP